MTDLRPDASGDRGDVADADARAPPRPGVAPLCRKPSGSYMARDDTPESKDGLLRPLRELVSYLARPASIASSSQARRRSMFAISGVLGIRLLRTSPPASRQLTIREGPA